MPFGLLQLLFKVLEVVGLEDCRLEAAATPKDKKTLQDKTMLLSCGVFLFVLRRWRFCPWASVPVEFFLSLRVAPEERGEARGGMCYTAPLLRYAWLAAAT